MARELPIHNGRMTTDLDANGFKIKNLPPGSGFTQAQADWSQTDATAPDFIKNKPTIPVVPTLATVATSGSYNDLTDKPTIPTPVSVDASLTTQGAAADAKAVGDALRGGFTEWVCDEIGPGMLFNGCEWDEDGHDGAGWYASIKTGTLMPVVKVYLGSDRDAIALSAEDEQILSLSRRLITPTKTSQLVNDGDGTSAFVKTNDSRLSDARTPTAHAHAMADVTGLNAALAQKANTSDLPYRLVEPGKWEFSGLPEEAVYSSGPTYSNGTWTIYLDLADSGNTYQLNCTASENAMSLSFPYTEWGGIDGNTGTLVATRASLPGHLCARAGNRVVVSGDTTLTLPAAVPGHLRDFLVRL